jgi:hypothetical protein
MVMAHTHGLPRALHMLVHMPSPLVEATLTEPCTGGPQTACGGLPTIRSSTHAQPKALSFAPLDDRAPAWLTPFTRVMTRWDRCHARFPTFAPLALCMIPMRRVQAFMK